MELCWVGPRESDIDFTDEMFCRSVTVYGSGVDGNSTFCNEEPIRVNHNIVTDAQIAFNDRVQQEIIDSFPDIRFMSYNPYYAYIGDGKIKEKTICLNPLNLIERFRDKVSFRKFASEFVSIPTTLEMPRNQCTYESLKRSFPGCDSFVVQKRASSGGLGTVLVDSARTVLPPDFRDEASYMVSPAYARNIPVNIHAIIYEKSVLTLPPSIQLICPHNGRLLYKGADYITFRDLPDSQRLAFVEDSRKLCREIGKTGYRGIIGLDAMITPDGILFLEANVRFQASSQILNKSLSENGLPTLHELNIEAFTSSFPKKTTQQSLFEMHNLYSNMAYTESDQAMADHLISRFEHHPCSFVSRDGYSDAEPAEKDAYLYRTLFDVPISWPTQDNRINIAQNLLCLSPKWENALYSGDASMMKIALLNQGARLNPDDRKALESSDTFVMGVNSAIDLRINEMVVNVPVDIPFSEFSPFSIHQKSDQAFEICYLGKLIGSCELATTGAIAAPLEESYSQIGLLATDRLRLSHNNCCVFKEMDCGCLFCDLPRGRLDFDVKKAKSAFDWFKEKTDFRHVLIGGGSSGQSDDFYGICALAKHIRSKDSHMPIYAMCLPPSDLHMLAQMKEAGVTDVAFNIELCDRRLRAEYMPAKGRIPISDYWCALEEARKVWPEPNAVKSALIVGLESDESFFAGVEELAKRGVSPVLSVFRPLRGTAMENVIPPSNEKLLELLEKARLICAKYHVSLGPSCAECQNNTLN